MKEFAKVLLIVITLSISTNVKAAEIANLTVTSGEFSGSPALGGAFPFITPGPAAFTHFGGYNLVNDFPTPVGWNTSDAQSGPHPSAVVAFQGLPTWSNFFMANSHLLDPSGLTYNSPSGTVNGVQATISDGDAIEFDMDGLFINWNGNVFNVGGVATGTVTNVSGNSFDYTVSWSGNVNSGVFVGQEYNLTFSGTGSVSPLVSTANIVTLTVTGGEFAGSAASGGLFPFIVSGPTEFTHFGSYNLAVDFPTPVGWDPSVAQSGPRPSAVTAFQGVPSAPWTNFFMADSHFLDPSGLTYNSPSGTVTNDTIQFDMDGFFLNWNGSVFNAGGVATGTVTNVSGNTFDYSMSWTGIVTAGPFVNQEYNLIFSGSGIVDISPDGDLNLDGNVDTSDIVLARRAAVGNYLLTPTQLIHGDVAPLVGGIPNPDGVFNAADMLVITRKAMGQINF